MIHALTLILQHLTSGNDESETVSMSFHWYPDFDVHPLAISSTYNVPIPESPGTFRQEGGENLVDMTRDEAQALHAFLTAALTLTKT